MSFQQGLSGLNAASAALDTIGNNIANSGTVGFKQATTQFADVFAASLSGGGTAPIGLGARVAAVSQQFTQGNVSVTNNALDLAINGGGFFRLQNALGDVIYSRNGQFQLNKDGYIVNAKGQQLMGYPLDATGAVSTQLGALRLFDPTSASDNPPVATGSTTNSQGLQVNVNLDAGAAPPASLVPPVAWNWATLSSNMYNHTTTATVYDSLGDAHTVSMYFRKTAPIPPASTPITWDVYTSLDGATSGNVSGPHAIAFDSSGRITTPQPITPSLSYTGLTNGAADLTIPLTMTGTTQFGSDFAPNSITQDGYASGKLAGFSIGTDGTIIGRYTNGQSKSMGQVMLSSFRNPQGLQPLGDNTWAATSDSGAEMTGAPGSSAQFGPMQSAALEDSNVDLTKELVAMIVQQRTYQANAQTIKTQDQVLQTLVNLR
jgi:flagellar hook protein FlgE